MQCYGDSHLSANKDPKMRTTILALLIGLAALHQAHPQDPPFQGASQPPPTHANVKYGSVDLQAFDIWLAESTEPTPIVLYIHGGGFRGGDKRSINAINRLMDYHDRIARVRMSTFNFNAVVNLFNQLLIPIIAVVLANLEKLIGLITK